MEVEAVQWTGNNWTHVRVFMGLPDDEPMFDELRGVTSQPILIRTLEGDMRAEAGDWIIRGIKGEFYPCKPDIFEKTYQFSGVSEPVKPQLWYCESCGALGAVMYDQGTDVMSILHTMAGQHKKASHDCETETMALRVIVPENIAEAFVLRPRESAKR